MPSFILIRPPFGHNTPTLQTAQDRTDRTYNCSNSIGRTVLQMVAQKLAELFAPVVQLILLRTLAPLL